MSTSSSPRRSSPSTPWTAYLMLLALCSVATAASIVPVDNSLAEGSLAIPADALLDIAMPAMVTAEPELFKRQGNSRDEDDSSTPSSASTSASASVVSSSSTVILSVTPPASSATEAPSALPSPFDTALASTFTSNDDRPCPSFLNALVSDSNFKKCYPVSMLLQSLVSIVRVLDEGCSADVEFCADWLSSVADTLILNENCGPDFERGNTVVKQAYHGLISYKMLYSATCLQHPETSMYCYASAVTNTTSASNVYFYLLPLNYTLPGAATPTCGWCLNETMAIFHAASADRSQPIANQYERAAQQVNTICGPEFVNDTLPEPTENLAFSSFPSWITMTTAILLALFLQVL